MNQHYLPVFYLSNFTTTSPDRQGPYVWVFRHGSWSKSSPSRTASAPDYYAFKDKDGNVDNRIEDLLGRLESASSPVIAGLASSPPEVLSEQDRSILSFFVASMRLRVPGFIDAIASSTADVYKKAHWLQYQQFKENPEAFERAKAWLQREKQLDCPDMTVDDLHPDKYSIEVPNAYVVSTALQTLKKSAAILYRMNWTLLSVESPGFVTSEYPLVSKTPGGHPLFSGGWGNQDVEITFPLTSKIGLLCSWKGAAPYTLIKPTIEQLRTMNLRTIDNAFNGPGSFAIIAASKTFPGSNIIEAAIRDSAETEQSGVRPAISAESQTTKA